VAYADEDALQGTPVEFLVVDDEDIGFTQWISSAWRRGVRLS
jgi:hypothetical protein